MTSILYDYFVSGIDFDLSGNGGPECLKFLSSGRRLAESAFGMIISSASLYFGYHRLKSIVKRGHSIVDRKNFRYSTTRMFLLSASCFVIGMEVCYKLASKQGVFIFNPCHLLTFVQIYLLASPTTRISVIVYRLHLCMLHGPIMAILFPVTNTLFLPCECLVYWLEHALLIANPVFFIKSGIFKEENESNNDWFAWSLFAYGIWGWLHYLPLQGLGSLTLANLNSVLCPAISDPFYGPNYRTHAIWHQFLLTAFSAMVCHKFARYN